ncbi:MAG: hypothetical protein IKF38_04415 [Clostridia bacterium]|nr:hypothetical protein [Clostridia bacterium]
MNVLKKNKGITLIALIVTIVVLLILAGVTISQITGSESAMEKATQAREENKLGEELEQIKLCVVNAMSQGLDGKVSDSDLRTSLNGIVSQTEIEKVTGAGPWVIQGNSGREYKITNGGLVNAIDTMEKAIINSITVEERSKVPIIISNGDNIEEIKSCAIADTSIATVAKDTDGIWKITGGTLTGDLEEASTTMTIEGKSGNKIENISVTLLKVTTAKDIIPVPTSSTTSAYVKYAMNGQTEENAEMCKVLYNDSEHGLQIVTINPVSNVVLGKTDPIYKTSTSNRTDFEYATESYNNAIINLNNYSEEYIDNTNIAIDARCVGSLTTISQLTNKFDKKDNPDNLIGNINELTEDEKNLYLYKWSGLPQQRHKDKFIIADNNFTEDENKLINIDSYKFTKNASGEQAISTDGYWLASRYWLGYGRQYQRLYVRFIKANYESGNTKDYSSLLYLGEAFDLSDERINGLRPVFLINPTAKIKSGTGTSTDPYILEAGE